MSETMSRILRWGDSLERAGALNISVPNLDPPLDCDSVRFQSYSDSAWTSMKFVGDPFKGIFPNSKSLPPD
jgi:glucoamylase